MSNASLLYEGKAKKIYSTEEPGVLLVEFKDDVTAFNGKTKATIAGKSQLNNQISAMIFQYLSEREIPNHFIKQLSATEQLVKQVKMFPLEVVVRNRAAGSICRRLGFDEGIEFSQPIVELYYKNDQLDDPLINDEHAYLLGIADKQCLQDIKAKAQLVNKELNRLFRDVDLILVDIKLEYGIDGNGQVLLADELSPDNCRLWDVSSQKKLDKDVFRQGLGDLVAGYQEIINRLGGKLNEN